MLFPCSSILEQGTLSLWVPGNTHPNIWLPNAKIETPHVDGWMLCTAVWPLCGQTVFRKRLQGLGRVPLRTRSPLVEGLLAATSPPAPSFLPASPARLPSRPSPPPPPQFAALCNSDSLGHRQGCTEAPGCPGKRPALRWRLSGAGCPVRGWGGMARSSPSTRPRSAARSAAGRPSGTRTQGGRNEAGGRRRSGCSPACRNSGR